MDSNENRPKKRARVDDPTSAVTGASTPPTPILKTLASNVSNIGNHFNTAISQMSNTVNQSVQAVKRMNDVLESMLAKCIEIRTEVLRDEDHTGQVIVNVKVCNNSPLPIMTGGILLFQVTPVNIDRNYNYFDKSLTKISVADNTFSQGNVKQDCNIKIRMENAGGEAEISGVDLMPGKFRLFTFIFTPNTSIIKHQYHGKVTFSFDSPGSDSKLSTLRKFGIYKIQQIKPVKYQLKKSDKEIFQYFNEGINAKMELSYMSISVQALRTILGLHATEALSINNGLYHLDERCYIMTSISKIDSKIKNYSDIRNILLSEKCDDNSNSKTMNKSHALVYFLSNDFKQNEMMKKEFTNLSNSI